MQLATHLNGGSWTAQVLDSGKVDEQQFLTAIGNYFNVPVVADRSEERSIGQTLSFLPSRFVFQHHILPIEVEGELGRARDLRSVQLRRPAARVSTC